MKKNTPKLHSLRKRAIFFSATISILIVIISISGYSNFKSLHTESSLNLLKRDELLVRLSLIRSELLDSYKALNNFLLTPENNNYKQNIIINVKAALQISNELVQHDWVLKYKRKDVAVKLNENFQLLEKEVSELILVRLDSNNQYPSLAVGVEVMEPNRDKLNNAIALSMNEMSNDNIQIKKPKIYNTLIQIRHLWTKVLSNSRLYLANRVGTFNKDALPIQEKGIEVMFDELQLNLFHLKKSADKGELGFETTDAVDVMLESSMGWYEGYKKVKVINHSDEWRQDAKIMKEKVAPTIDSIIDLLVDIEKIITESSEDDVRLITSLSDVQNVTLWLLAFVGVFFTVAVIWSLDKLIFEPIAIISNALKLEAMGKRSEDLPVVKAKETEDLVNAFNEMSRQVHARQTELEYRALHDALTSLPNRTLLLDRIEHTIHTAKRESKSLSLLIIDLDDFKEVNDTLGHLAGDNLLIAVGMRIKGILRDVDTVARIGGDEFSVLLPNTNEENAVSTSKKIIDSLKDSIHIDNVDISVSASIGIAVYPEHGKDMHALLRHADIAMYVAKRHKLGFDVYNKDHDEHSITRLSMTKDFRDAIEHNKLDVHFQPIFDVQSNTIVGVEALCRWYHPKHGFIPPEQFITLAEQTGLINELTYWVLNKAISHVARWHKINKELVVAVNLSVYSFKDPDFIKEILSALQRYNFPSNKLKLEITESAMMENPVQATEVLTTLHDMGIKLSIDDFGTGFSSMSYLKQFPVNELKVDKSFIIGMDSDESNIAIVRSTIDLAHNLGLKVVAEGIETEAIYTLLNKYGCNMAQGFHLSHPLPVEEVGPLLKVS